jgi:hypothetical protein
MTKQTRSRRQHLDVNRRRLNNVVEAAEDNPPPEEPPKETPTPPQEEPPKEEITEGGDTNFGTGESKGEEAGELFGN